jgi:formamidopyrimidine-DNA glycosylase
VLVLTTTSGRVGLRFGMTGVLGVDGDDSLDELVYGPSRRDPAWIRFALQTSAGEVYVRDPRILGSVELDPDLTRLGPDATTVSARQLAAALGGSRTALKARLMDQSRVAGVGNLIADEALWRASLDPRRAAGSLQPAEVTALGRHLRRTVADLLRAGGSHLGRLTPHRHPGGRCPRDGANLQRSTVGGRTTWWCPRHQGAGTNP